MIEICEVSTELAGLPGSKGCDEWYKAQLADSYSRHPSGPSCLHSEGDAKAEGTAGRSAMPSRWGSSQCTRREVIIKAKFRGTFAAWRTGLAGTASAFESKKSSA